MTTIQEQHLGTFHERERTLFSELAAGSTSEVIGGGAGVRRWCWPFWDWPVLNKATCSRLRPWRLAPPCSSKGV